MPTVPFTDEENHRYDEFACLCISVQRFVEVMFDLGAMRPMRDSVAQADMDWAAGLLEDETSAAHRSVVIAVNAHLFAATNLLGTLAAIYNGQSLFFGPAVIARSIIEHCSAATWMLGRADEPSRSRVLRALLNVLEGQKNLNSQARLIPELSPEDLKPMTDQYEKLARDAGQIAAAQVETKHDNVDELGSRDSAASPKGRRTLGGIVLPGESAIVTAASELQGSSLTEAEIKASYKVLSNSVHANPMVVLCLFGVKDRPDAQRSFEPERGLPFHEELMRLTISFFYTALSTTLGYFGVRPESYDGFSDLLDNTLPGLFGQSTPAWPFSEPNE